MKKNTYVVVFVLVALLGITAFALVPALQQSVPGRMVRWCLGEPMATQEVDNAAKKMLAAGWDKELIALCDQLIKDYATTASTLPQAAFGGGKALPMARLPQKFHALGGHWDTPEFVLRLDASNQPTAVVLSWGHGRHEVIVYAQAPATPPDGFSVRRVNDRIYVVSNES